MDVYDHHDDDANQDSKIPWTTIFACAVIFLVASLLAFSLALAVFQ